MFYLSGTVNDFRTTKAPTEFEKVSITFEPSINEAGFKLKPILPEFAHKTINLKDGSGMNPAVKVPWGLSSIGASTNQIPVENHLKTNLINYNDYIDQQYPNGYPNKPSKKTFYPFNDATKNKLIKINDTHKKEFFDFYQLIIHNDQAGWYYFTATIILPNSLWILNNGADCTIKFDDESNNFFNQFIYQQDKYEVIKYFNFAFDILNQEDKQKLINGNDGNGWTVRDLNNGTMPSLINWNKNLDTLFQLEKISDLILRINVAANNAQLGSGWATAFRRMINVIKNYKFSSYDELEKLFLKYEDNGNQNNITLKEFEDELSKMETSSNNFNNNISRLDNDLRSNGIYTPSMSIGTSIPNITVTDDNIRFAPYKQLSLIIKGYLISNDIVCDIDTSVQNNAVTSQKTKNLTLYNSLNGEINNDSLKNAFIDVPEVDDINIFQTISINNIRIKNRLKTKFVNIDSSENDSYRFNKLNNIRNIKIKYDATSMMFSNFNFANWTANKDAIGIDLNRYLSQLIKIQDNNVKSFYDKKIDSEGDFVYQQPDFVDTNTKNDILNVLNNKYEFLDETTQTIKKVSAPIWITSAVYDDYQQQIADDIYSLIPENINMFLTKFNNSDWVEAFKKFDIEVDGETNNPIFVPNQTDGEFFVVTKIKRLFRQTQYQGFVNQCKNNNIPPIVLINSKYDKTNPNDQAINPNGDGYFLVKLKACFNSTYSTDINNLRRYNVDLAINSDKSISSQLINFNDNVLGGDNFKSTINTNKYFIQDFKDRENNTFFKDEFWVQKDYLLNTNKVWSDILSPEGTLIPANIKNNAVSYFKGKINDKLLDYLIETNGQESVEVQEYLQYQTKMTDYNSMYNILANNYTINSKKPILFDNKILNDGLDAYTIYNDIQKEIVVIEVNLTNPNITPEVKLQLEQQKKQKTEKLNTTKFAQFLNANEKDPRAPYSNDEIMMLFTSISNIVNNIINAENKDEHDEYLSETFKKFRANWNSANDGGSINYNGEVINYGEWVTLQKEWIDEHDLSIKYKDEAKAIFKQDYDYLINDLVNKVAFNIGEQVNNNLVFSSIEEMIQDPLIKIIFEKYNLNIDEAFIKHNYNFGSKESNYVYYTLNENYKLPFNISTKSINNQQYFILENNGNLVLDVGFDFLCELAEIKYVDKNKTFYKVFNKNQFLYDSLNKGNDIAKQIKDKREYILNLSKAQSDYWTKINVGAILLVTLLPIGVLSAILLIIWLIKSKKRKSSF